MTEWPVLVIWQFPTLNEQDALVCITDCIMENTSTASIMYSDIHTTPISVHRIMHGADRTCHSVLPCCAIHEAKQGRVIRSIVLHTVLCTVTTLAHELGMSSDAVHVHDVGCFHAAQFIPRYNEACNGSILHGIRSRLGGTEIMSPSPCALAQS